MAARLLLVIAAVLGLLAMHSLTPADASLGAGDHPAAISVAAAVPSATDSISSDPGHGGCCATTCDDMSLACVSALSAYRFTVPDVTALATTQTVQVREPAVWWAEGHAPPWRSIGLVVAALAVTRI